jgi:hypothetical protein
MADHLARLCLDGTASTGFYTPHGFDVTLYGADLPVDHMVYMHEVQHCALNDETAWGTALHVYARMPGADATFTALLDACRLTHETFATYSSVRLAAARHGDIGEILTAYSAYRVPHADAERLVSGVTGANRRLLALSAAARVCMQGPIIDAILHAGPRSFALADLRERDRPDTRWAWFLDRAPASLAEAARAGDRRLRADFDGTALNSDAGDDLHASTVQEHDQAWEAWEEAAYEHLAGILAATGALTHGIYGHRQPTADLLARISEEYGDLGLRDAMSEAQRRDDAAVASSVLQQVRHSLSGDRPYPAMVLPSMDIEPLVGDGTAVVHIRTANRLAALYRWPSGTRLPSGPVAALRAFVDADGDEMLGHLILAEPDRLPLVASPAPVAVCVSAACLADTGWTRRWWKTLLAHPVFVLVDVEPDRFVPAWARGGDEVLAVGIEIRDTGGTRAALLCTPDGGTIWWLTLGNDVTVHLMAEYLRGLLGTRLRTRGELPAGIHTAAMAVITSLLATESFVSFDALGGRDG